MTPGRPTPIACITTLCASLWFAQVGWAVDDACVHYAPAIVAVTGKLFVREDFGPPNYGENPETDSRERHIYVTLDSPLCVHAGDKQSDFAPAERNIKTMQLVYFTHEKQFDRAWIGKRVQLRGTLFHSHTGHHWTPVLMEVMHTTPLD